MFNSQVEEVCDQVQEERKIKSSFNLGSISRVVIREAELVKNNLRFKDSYAFKSLELYMYRTHFRGQRDYPITNDRQKMLERFHHCISKRTGNALFEIFTGKIPKFDILKLRQDFEQTFNARIIHRKGLLPNGSVIKRFGKHGLSLLAVNENGQFKACVRKQEFIVNILCFMHLMVTNNLE